MQENKIHETSNYELFDLYEINRMVRYGSRRYKNLVTSMLKHGFIVAYPLHCIKDTNGKLKIKAGHHRFAAAQSLNIPVKYVIGEDSARVDELEGAGPGTWNASDYLYSYCKKGVWSYLHVKDYIDRTGIGVQDAVSMHYGESAGSGNWNNEKWKMGEFRIREYALPNNMAVIVSQMKSVGCTWSANTRFINAMSKALFLENFDIERFLNKIKTFPELLQKQRDVDGYLKLIEEVYNYKAPAATKENIAFLAREASDLRNKSFGSKMPMLKKPVKTPRKTITAKMAWESIIPVRSKPVNQKNI